jgi:hypothetical protein
LYLGTENSLFVSFDDGATWAPLQTNLPHAPVHWLTIQEHFNDLVVATYGRGFWILDDITPLQLLSDEVLDSDLHLFAPRPAYRFLSKQPPMSQPEDPGAGRNPVYGATLHYSVAEGMEGSATVTILDGDGGVVRELRPRTPRPGLNRIHWDLRYGASETPRMRTKVLEHSHVPIGDDGWRPAGETGRVAPLAPPGAYTVSLRMGEVERTRPLTVLKDPSSSGTEADIRSQVEVLLQLRDDANAVVQLINRAELIRSQIVSLKERMGGAEDSASILSAADAVDQALIDLEMKLTDLRLSGGTAGQDRLRWPRQLYAKITSLAGYIEGTDFPPTTQQLEVHALLRGHLHDHQDRMRGIEEGELAALNVLLQERGIPHVTGG